MPQVESAVQAQGFRSRLFGFDKDDVLAYVSALAADAQQQELAYQDQIRQLQSQLDKLRGEQSNARACVEKLQEELAAAEQRATLSEKQYDEIAGKLSDSEKRAAEYASRSREAQQAANEWQFKCRDTQRQLEAKTRELEEKAAQPAPVLAPPPAPAEPTEEARLEARRILADARLSAENAEKHLQAQAQEQQARMAENARGLAAGVLVLRDRLARVDARLDAAALDLENATSAIYQALDAADADLRTLGAQMENFGQTAPADPAPAQPQAAAPRRKVTAQPIARRARPVRQAAPAPAHRLRRTAGNTVSQELLDALDRLEEQ